MAAQPNGTAEAPIEVPALPTVVGINFGNSYASIAVLTQVCARLLLNGDLGVLSV